MNNGPHLQNDVLGDAAGSGPGSTLQVLAHFVRSGLSASTPIAPPHGPPFNKARERNEFHQQQHISGPVSADEQRRRTYRQTRHQKELAYLIELHTQPATV